MTENILLAFQGIWSHKLRSFLTMLGIIIGIAAIIAIVSTIRGTNEQIKKNLIGSGTNAVEIRLCQDGYEYDLSYSALPNNVKVIGEDVREELAAIDHVEAVSLFRERNWVDQVFYRNTQFSGKVIGADENYFPLYGYRVTRGRGWTQRDFDRAGNVVILDEGAAQTLFAGRDPIGQTVEIIGQPFTVIGVAAQSDDFQPVINSINDYYTYKDTSGDKIFIPTDSWPKVFRFDEPQTAALRVDETDNMTGAGQKAAEILTGRQILPAPDQTFAYKSQDAMEQAQQLAQLSTSTNRQLLWIASISLLVGGIGVMNIMMVSVTERTREIGLKLAIGAKKKRIRAQFLTEAAVLTGLGGLFGIGVGIAMAQLIGKLTGMPVAISVPAAAVAFMFSTVIGIVFGLVPAIKASDLNPIEALKYE